MSEAEIKNIDDVQSEVAEILREYNLSDEDMEEAARRVANLLIDALDASRENRRMV